MLLLKSHLQLSWLTKADHTVHGQQRDAAQAKGRPVVQRHCRVGAALMEEGMTCGDCSEMQCDLCG